MPDADKHALILRNALRLLNDAGLLLDNKRFASAFALAVLGVEEIGKALLVSWESDRPLAKSKDRQSAHIRKQMAVAALLVGALTVQTFPGGTLDFESLDFEAATRAFNESSEGELFVLIQSRQLDWRKQNALYQDEEWATSVEDTFAEEHVASVFEIAEDALEAFREDRTKEVARAIFETTLVGDGA